MDNSFDIIITTYNRPNFIKSLVQEINNSFLLPKNIIIVDSSDKENKEIQTQKLVKYIRSSHKNQPYQRFLGLNLVKSEIVVFFDDDVKILDKNLFNYSIKAISEKGVVGATFRFSDAGKNAISIAMNSKINKNKKSKLKSLFLTFTGAPNIKNNKIWLAGLKSDFDYSKPYTEVIGGPGTLTTKTNLAKKIFDDDLFAMYETKLGKGEDKYISIGLLKFGKIALIPKECIYHPPHKSNYFKDAYSFSKRELFSRLWLSKRIANIKKIPLFYVYIHFYWYAFWRIIMAIIKIIKHPTKININSLKGKIKAFLISITTSMEANKLTPNINWTKEIDNDLKARKKYA